MSENRYQLRDFVLPGDPRSEEELADLQVSVRLSDYVTFINALARNEAAALPIQPTRPEVLRG